MGKLKNMNYGSGVCGAIIHIYAPIYFEEVKPIEKLKESYLKLIDVMKREEYKSIIIPSIGTRFHGYQHENVAEMVVKFFEIDEM